MGILHKDATAAQIEEARLTVGPTSETGDDKAANSGAASLRKYSTSYFAGAKESPRTQATTTEATQTPAGQEPTKKQ